jgi:hypothetical protein
MIGSKLESINQLKRAACQTALPQEFLRLHIWIREKMSAAPARAKTNSRRAYFGSSALNALLKIFPTFVFGKSALK